MFENSTKKSQFEQNKTFFFSDGMNNGVTSEDNYTVPHNARQPLVQPQFPPPPGKGRIVIGPSGNDQRRRLPQRPQMPTFPQGQRALPGTMHIYGNLPPPPPNSQDRGMSYISAPGGAPASNTSSPRGPPTSAFLTNLANKRMMASKR